MKATIVILTLALLSSFAWGIKEHSDLIESQRNEHQCESNFAAFHALSNKTVLSTLDVTEGLCPSISDKDHRNWCWKFVREIRLQLGKGPQ